ncbi:hypothetical protein PIB30_078396 [Stylosanthes scabra]|uniref:Uncharacterized protein n=1 Tax=Stylosanthes scabra TaxID=79078 RepID=A0ABU6RRK1_9FABA|nr:hypothetical protein [Stylosanthes scabra]
MRTPPTRTSPRLAVESTSGYTITILCTQTTRSLAYRPGEPFSRRLAERTTPSRATPKKRVLIMFSSNDEPENKSENPTTELVGMDEAMQEKEEEDPEELPKEESQDLWDLTEPSTSSSERGYDKGDDPHFWNYDGDLFDWQNTKPSEGSVGSCTEPPPIAN